MAAATAASKISLTLLLGVEAMTEAGRDEVGRLLTSAMVEVGVPAS